MTRFEYSSPSQNRTRSLYSVINPNYTFTRHDPYYRRESHIEEIASLGGYKSSSNGTDSQRGYHLSSIKDEKLPYGDDAETKPSPLIRNSL